jgi:hypothetical protein
MTRRILIAGLVVGSLLLAPRPSRAQFIVHDPTSYAQALVTYGQLVQQYLHWIRQARRLPADMATRYRVPEVLWRIHDDSDLYAGPLLTALNYGDPVGGRYYETVDRLSAVEDVLPRLPETLRRRMRTGYATLQAADSIATMAIHQAGAIRFNGRRVLETIRAMEDDLVAFPEEFHTQTALLNKINGAGVLNLRIAERNSQFLLHTLEQLLLDNKRKRDTEAQLMNAHLHRWRFAEAYAADLFRHTARQLDDWRQP